MIGVELKFKDVEAFPGDSTYYKNKRIIEIFLIVISVYFYCKEVHRTARTQT